MPQFLTQEFKGLKYDTDDCAFENLVQQQIQKFTAHSWREVETISALKRWSGFAPTCRRRKFARCAHPSQVFDLLFFSYMGLQPEYLPIVSESDDEIVWRRSTPAHLDACQRLGLDTRQVCRDAFEKSTQVSSRSSTRNCASCAATARFARTPPTAWSASCAWILTH